MLSCILGDIIESRHSLDSQDDDDWTWLTRANTTTDQSLMVIACMDWILQGATPDSVLAIQQKWQHHYRGNLNDWSFKEESDTHSNDNTALIRCAPIAWAAATPTQAQEWVKHFTQPSHHHKESYKTVATYIAILRSLRVGIDKDHVLTLIHKGRQDTWEPPLPEYYRRHKKTQRSRKAWITLEESFLAWYHSDSIDMTVRTCIDLKGDANACVAGGFAEAYWGLPEPHHCEQTFERLPKYIRDVVIAFYDTYPPSIRSFNSTPNLVETPRSYEALARWNQYPIH